MIELSKITWVGGILGLSIIIISLIKWFFIAIFFSRLVFGLGLGFTMICFSYFYECLKLHDMDKLNLHKRLDNLTTWARRKGYEKGYNE